MAQYANVSSIPLSIAVFLATDNYDYNEDPNTISATALLKPIRQLILPNRIPKEDVNIDLIQMLSNRMGSAIHDGFERAWIDVHKNRVLEKLGYPAGMREKVIINPAPDIDVTDMFPVYLEQRAHRVVGKFTVSGKYDFVANGRVEDLKTTSVWTAISGNSDEKYILQGSIYRWLNPNIITQDVMAIQWIFTDWNRAEAMRDKNYPQGRHQEKLYILKSVEETEAFVTRKLEQIEQYWDADEADIPECSDEDLWRSEPVFKYYKNPQSTARSTKNFSTHQEAFARFIEDGSVGLVKEVAGQVKACRYCPAFLACKQKDRYIESGELTLL